jgi:uncharacterized protein
MSRPRCCRRIAGRPPCSMFKPAGIPATALEKVTLGLDEMEALRLADLLGLYQEDAARQMNVSRQTFGRIIDVAHKKVAEALTAGKVLCIEGGIIEVARKRVFRCRACKARWELPCGTGRPNECPKCKQDNFFRVPCKKDPGQDSGKGCSRSNRGKTRQVRRSTRPPET